MFAVRPFEARALTWWRDERPNINMNPVYQRGSGLWTKRDRAYLIDSIINEFDIPKIYIADFTYVNTPLNEDERPYAVIDGKQRFGAIFGFFDGDLVLDKRFVYFKDPSLALGGLSYADLLRRYPQVARSFENFNLTVMSVITDELERINDLFVRLNRSKPLTGAELRNAMPGLVPSLIRQIAEHEFFKSRIAFRVDRKQDLNAAAKLLLIEARGRFVGTTKPNLDRFAEEGVDPKNPSAFETHAERVTRGLDDMVALFVRKDSLLRTQGPLTLYYWFIRNLPDSGKQLAREFLVKFEDARLENRELAKQRREDADDELLRYDILNRSTDNQGTLEGRYEILKLRLRRFVKSGEVT